MFVVGIDIGGTFTDVCVIDRSNGTKIVEAKSPTTPDDLLRGVFNGLEMAAEELGESLPDLLHKTERFSHATTQTSNVIFTFSGARVGLLTTRGMEDQVLIMRGIGRVAGLSLRARRHPRATDKPPLLVDETRIRGVRERMDWEGDIVSELDEDHARQCIQELLDEGVEAIAVSLLWSFMNPTHERRLRELIYELAPDMYVSISSDIAPLRGEYERTATTVLNAYVGPTLARYINRLEEELANAGYRFPMLVVQANGGVVHSEQLTPVQTIESGPAVGVMAAKTVAERSGFPKAIATDVGGTTFKVAVLDQKGWATTKETVINQYGLWLPMVDVVSIGAGGGSIAWVDDRRLRVGPQSAEADPGPVAYGRGGKDPTVTDADIILGYLNPAYFWGGRLTLNIELARQAMKEQVADHLFGGDVVKAAAGVKQVTDHQMADLIRKATVERGYDVRDFTLIAYGGMGPCHCTGFARAAGIDRIIIPARASIFSAFGAATSDIIHSLSLSDMHILPVAPARVQENFAKLEAQANSLFDKEGVPTAQRRFARWVEMRYRRQMHEVRVSVPAGDITEDVLRSVTADFEATYENLYGAGAAYREAGIEIVNFGIEARGLSPSTGNGKRQAPAPAQTLAPRDHREVYCLQREQWIEAPIYDGRSLYPGWSAAGLTVLEYPQTTVLVERDFRATISDEGNVILERI